MHVFSQAVEPLDQQLHERAPDYFEARLRVRNLADSLFSAVLTALERELLRSRSAQQECACQARLDLVEDECHGLAVAALEGWLQASTTALNSCPAKAALRAASSCGFFGHPELVETLARELQKASGSEVLVS